MIFLELFLPKDSSRRFRSSVSIQVSNPQSKTTSSRTTWFQSQLIFFKAFLCVLFLFQLVFLLLSEYDFLSGIFVKEEIEMHYENNEEAGPSGFIVKEELDEAAGIKTFWLFYIIRLFLSCLYIWVNRFCFYVLVC